MIERVKRDVRTYYSSVGDSELGTLMVCFKVDHENKECYVKITLPEEIEKIAEDLR
jgi:hypothetical protein